MSFINQDGRISVPPFAGVPALGDFPAMQEGRAPVPDVDRPVDLSEGCLVTKSVMYTHESAHWITFNRERSRNAVENDIVDMCIVPYEHFSLDDACNRRLLEPSVHISLHRYDFIAVTPSFATLESLIMAVGSDNRRRQMEMDTQGMASSRSLDFSISSFTHPEYELIALQPEHFLPNGNVLTVYDPPTKTHKNYVAAKDRRLRESPEPSSPRFPPFSHNDSNRTRFHRLNVFLIVLNADIKFRSYFHKLAVNPPASPLPDDVLVLMRMTMELVDLLHWDPVPIKDSSAEEGL